MLRRTARSVRVAKMARRGHLRAAMPHDGFARPRGRIQNTPHMGDLAMPWRRLAALAVALAMGGALSAQAVAQRWEKDDDRAGRSEWILLGEKTVKFKVDRDVIVVDRADEWYPPRGFRRLHLVAENSD